MGLLEFNATKIPVTIRCTDKNTIFDDSQVDVDYQIELNPSGSRYLKGINVLLKDISFSTSRTSIGDDSVEGMDVEIEVSGGQLEIRVVDGLDSKFGPDEVELMVGQDGRVVYDQSCIYFGNRVDVLGII